MVLTGFALLVPVEGNLDGVSPPEGCTCHSEEASPGIKVVVDGWPAIYTPDSTYTLAVTATGSVSGSAGGFSMEVTKGSLYSSDPMVSASGKVATHSGPDHRQWTVEWRAPPEDSGDTSLVTYVNLANGDESEGEEDHWNVLTLSAKEKAPEPPKPSRLSLAFSGENGTLVAGRNITITATLTNFSGAPIRNAIVTFYQNTSYGQLAIGKNKTGADGRTPINWTVVSACECLFFAHYDGSSKNLSENATALASVTDPNGVFDTLYPPQTPFVFMQYYAVRGSVGLVIGAVWLTLLYAGLSVFKVRSLGASGGDGAGGPLSILSSRSRKKVERK